ncbi:MAG: alpha/beta hydrolase [Holophagales bacterium]|nr:alpha/beta hydrolase [Holophagales bacterium]
MAHRSIRIEKARTAPALVVIAWALAIGAGGAAGQSGREGARWLSECTLGSRVALCGTYDVWEDRASRSGRRIGINVVVAPARGPSPVPDPIFVFVGGPGLGAAELLDYDLVSELHEERDLVYIDLRGTGRSNRIDCPPPAETPAQWYFGGHLEPRFVRDCLSAIDHADVSFYTTPLAMDDVDEIRQALGYERINMVGTSYGTRAIQVYLRRHPESVRTAVLAGVAPTDFKSPLPLARALERGIERVMRECQRRPGCKKEYPDLPAEWKAVKDRFEQGPVTAKLEHPESGELQTVSISAGVFADGLRRRLYSKSGAAQVPGFLRDAARGDLSSFAAYFFRANYVLRKYSSEGVFLSVTCAEDVRFITEAEIARQTAGTFMGDYRVRAQQAACAAWPKGRGVSDRFTHPVRADTPTLLLAGELDPATPPEWARAAADPLAESLLVLFPDESHNIEDTECLRSLVTSFVRRGSSEGVDVGCAAASEEG